MSVQWEYSCCASELEKGIHLHRSEISELDYMNRTSMLPCIVIDFFLNNQPDALIIKIYSVIKLYMFRAPPLPIIRSSLLYIRHC